MSSNPTYNLGAIKSAFGSISTLRMTGSARRDAFGLGFSDQDVVDAIQALRPVDLPLCMMCTNQTSRELICTLSFSYWPMAR